MRNRVPHYDFGRTPVDYQSSNKHQFTEHDLSQANQSKIDAANTSKDVRKSHFLFGTDTAALGPQTTKAHMTPMKSAYPGRLDSSTMGAAKTNI